MYKEVGMACQKVCKQVTCRNDIILATKHKLMSPELTEMQIALLVTFCKLAFVDTDLHVFLYLIVVLL